MSVPMPLKVEGRKADTKHVVRAQSLQTSFIALHNVWPVRSTRHEIFFSAVSRSCPSSSSSFYVLSIPHSPPEECCMNAGDVERGSLIISFSLKNFSVDATPDQTPQAQNMSDLFMSVWGTLPVQFVRSTEYITRRRLYIASFFIYIYISLSIFFF